MAETAEEILARQDAESLARVRTVAAATRQTERAVTEWERLDLLVDTDPLALRDEAWTLVNKLDAADALVRRLGKHLTALCDHPVNWEKRYRTEDGAPCTGCYDARDAYQAYIAEAGS